MASPVITTTTARTQTGGELLLPSLRRSFCWTFAGNVTNAACQWGVLVLLAKLGNPEMVGQFGLGLAITAPVMMFSSLQLRTVQATDPLKTFAFGDYFGLTVFTATLGILVITAISLGAGYHRETFLVILAIGMGKGFAVIGNVFYGLLQRWERMDRIALAMTLHGIFALVALGGLLRLTGSVVWGAVGWGLASALTLVAYTIASVQSILKEEGETLWPRWHPTKLISLTCLTLPLGLSTLLLSLNANIPCYVIGHYRGERELGIFAALSSLFLAGNTAVMALWQSASPRLAKYYTAGDAKAFRGLLVKQLQFGAVIGTAAIGVSLLIGREVLTLFFGDAYAEHANVLVWLAVAAAFTFISSFPSCAITATHHFILQTLLSGTVTIVTVLAGTLLVPVYGISGGAFSLIAGAGVQLIFSIIIVENMIRKVEDSNQEQCQGGVDAQP